jgi:glycerol kinase
VILAIDQGTSGTKAIVLDPARGVLASVEIAVRPSYLPGGGVEQDPFELLESVLAAGRRVIDAAGGPIDAVALANQGETVLAWAPESGHPLSPAIGWQDRRSEELCGELAAHKDWVAQRTGLVLDPYFSAPKMAWLRRNVTADGVVTTTDSWLVHQLTGEFVTDASTASRSLLLDVDRVAWDAELLSLFGLQDECLPRIVASDEIVGTTRAFGPELAVAGLIVDQQAALLAEGCVEPGYGKCTFGTGAFLLVNVGDRAPRSGAGLTTSVAWRAGGQTTYCVDGQVYTAASAVRWLQDLGLIKSAADLDAVAAEDAQGVLCVPALAGLAAPWWRADATASFSGLTLSTRAGQLILAVLQGVAAQVAELTALVEADLGVGLARLRVDGGLTRCQTLMQATADLLQRPIDVYPSADATALGAAAFARLALDPQLGIERAVPAWNPSMSYEPRWSADRAAEFLERWRAAVALSLPIGPASLSGLSGAIG